MSYTVTDDNGVETFETMTDLFDGLIMRGKSAAEATLIIGGLLAKELTGE